MSEKSQKWLKMGINGLKMVGNGAKMSENG
jgi:hypothetical protein